MPRSKKNESSIEFDETRILRLLETSLKYKEVPELAGTWIPIESFETLEEDLLSAIQPAIPHIRGLCETDRNWLPESSLVTFLLRYSFKVNLVVDNFDIEPGPGKEILESLCILTEENGHLALEPDWEEQTRLSFERSLRENQNKLFLRLYMNHCDDLTVRWDRGKKNKEQIEEETLIEDLLDRYELAAKQKNGADLYTLDRDTAILVLICMYVGAIYGGSRSAILRTCGGTSS